ncbi:MAG: hypothetical protein KDF64_19590 [Geminicoccaceae bacterium]|nr:hypothetical protein [Geminicoccaceae bacterium]
MCGANVLSVIVATGRNSGAKRELANGTYRFGSDLECEIVLFGSDMPAFAFTLEIDGNRPKISVETGSIRLEARHSVPTAELAAGKSTRLDMPAIVHVGSTCLLFTDATPIGGVTGDDAEHRATGRPGLLVAGGAAVLAVIASLAIGSASFGSDPDPLALVNERLKGLGLGGELLLEQSGDGTPHIRGVLGNDDRIAEVREAFADIDVGLTLSPTATIEPALRSILREENEHVRWTLMDRGAVRLEGIVAESMTRDSIGRSLANIVPGIAATENRLVTITEVGEAVSVKLAELELADELSVQRVEGELSLAGSVARMQQDRIGELLEWYERRYGMYRRLRLDISGARENDPLDRLQAIILDDDPRLVMNGKRHVRPGEEIGDGWILETISESGIAIFRQGEVRTVNF